MSCSEWKEYRLDEIGDIVSGGTPSTKNEDYYGNEIPWITPKDLSGYDSKYISKGERSITKLGLEKSSAKLLPKGTILFSSRAPIGYVAIAQEDLCTNQGFKNIVCNPQVAHNEFIYYRMKLAKEELESVAGGSTFKEVSGKVMKEFKIKLPSIEQQKRIASILSSLDDKIELNNEMNKTLEEMAQSIFKRWFVDFEFPNEDGQPYKSSGGEMVKKYLDGAEVVYGVRSKRDTDTFFKRFTAESFYKLLNAMGAEVVYNHADYRLMSARVLHEFANFKEVNLFLRGMVPLVGFKSTSVAYERHERIAGESHYPLSKMLSLAFDGITSLSIKPIRFITGFGVIVALISFIGVIWAMVEAILGLTVSGWASMTSIICFVSGVQLICLGVIGEYIGKIYMETKHRPRYIISETTPNFGQTKEDNA